MRSQLDAAFVSLATERYEQDGQARRFDELYVLQHDTGKVLTIRVPAEAVGVAENLANTCKLGQPVTLLVDVRSFANGKRSTLSFSLVYGEALDVAAA